jgi:hypothetical protein
MSSALPPKTWRASSASFSEMAHFAGNHGTIAETFSLCSA